MTNAALMPFVLPRQFTLDGKPLSGGKIFTYKSGTNVPKITYATADKSVANTNPVILDAAGFAPIFLDTGAYRILVQDSTGVQVEYPIDGVVGSGGSFLGGDESVTLASVIAVDTYNDLRNLINTYDIVLVAGRDQVGDGGEGTFIHHPSSTAYDDDGITLSTTAGVVYYREFDATINPLWFGLQYGVSQDQANNVLKCQNASAHYGYPVDYAGSTYLSSNLTIPTNSSMIASFAGAFTSGTTAVTMTFADGAEFSATATSVFGAKVNVSFGAGCTDAIRLSWFGGTTGDDKIAKWVSSSTKPYTALLDANLTTGTSFTLPSNLSLDVQGGKITINSAISVSIGNCIYAGIAQFLSYGTVAMATAISVYPYAKPEWFGAVGDGTTDDTAPLNIAVKTGNVYLSANKSYKATSQLVNIPASQTYTGSGTIKLAANTNLNSTSIKLKDCTISLATIAYWFTGTNLTATNAVFASTYSATNAIIDGCTYADDTRNPVYAGTPAIYNAYLPLVTNANRLTTNAQGKIVSAQYVNNLNQYDLTYSYVQNSQYNQAPIGLQNFTQLKYLNSKWIALGTWDASYSTANIPYVGSSTDFVNWSAYPASGIGGHGDAAYDIVWTGTNYLTVTVTRGTSAYPVVWTSPDLVTWSSGAYLNYWNNAGVNNDGYRFIGYNSATGHMCISGQDSKIMQSFNSGASWTGMTLTFGGLEQSFVGYVNGYMLVTGDNAMIAYSSDNGATYSTVQWRAAIGNTKIANILLVNGYFVVIGVNGNVGISNAIASVPQSNAYSLPGSVSIRRASTDGSNIVAVGDSGVIMVSYNNGQSWSKKFSGVSDNLTGVQYQLQNNGQARFVIGGNNRAILQTI